MKTIAKTLVVISMLMISLQIIAGNPTLSKKVNYQVQIHLQKDIHVNSMNIFVAMTDGHNKMIAAPQLLRDGKVSYDFYESSTVLGTRVAQLIYTEPNTPELIYSSPDIQNGKFAVGGTYLFNLYIVIQKPGSGEE